MPTKSKAKMSPKKSLNQFEVRNRSVVLLGGFSPQSFSGEMLIANEIVPKTWNWKFGDFISTPALTMVQINGGELEFRVERNKIQLVDNGFPKQGSGSKRFPEFAKRIVQKQSYLSFLALGINFLGVVIVEDGEEYIKSRFLGDRDITPGHPVSTLGLSLVYMLDTDTDRRLVVKLDPGSIESVGPLSMPTSTGIVFQGNYHVPLAPDANVKSITTHLNGMDKDWELLEEIVRTI